MPGNLIQKHKQTTSTIAAVATPRGRGGIGIVRISGPLAEDISRKISGIEPQPNEVKVTTFRDGRGEPIDQGLLLFFREPHSFTGENVAEFHAHGGPVILDMVLRRVLELGAQMARPGEFSERAFLNNKVDLSQAEAIADLISSTSEQAARSAVRTLQGEFSTRINAITKSLIRTRVHVEAMIDFPEDEVEPMVFHQVLKQLQAIGQQIKELQGQASKGVLLREGIKVAIIGKPNSGKSSLLNQLAGLERAIVTPVEGTTRDTLLAEIHLNGIPLHLVDTAGIRASEDEIEIEGMRRTWQEVESADHVLIVVDGEATKATKLLDILPEYGDQLAAQKNLSIIRNKIDLTGELPGVDSTRVDTTGVDTSGVDTSGVATHGETVVRLSAKTGQGVDLLRTHLLNIVGAGNPEEGVFIARRRHLEAIQLSAQHLEYGIAHLQVDAIELLAEELRLSHQAMGQITGEFSSDDLLGRIFSDFCIGK